MGFFKKQERDFKGVYVPKEIWLSPELKPIEKLIFMEIHSLDRDFGCVAENEHFMDWLGLSERQVRDYIKRLKDKAMISVKINKAKDTRTMRVIGKYGHITDEQLADIELMRQELAGKFKRF